MADQPGSESTVRNRFKIPLGLIFNQSISSHVAFCYCCGQFKSVVGPVALESPSSFQQPSKERRVSEG